LYSNEIKVENKRFLDILEYLFGADECGIFMINEGKNNQGKIARTYV